MIRELYCKLPTDRDYMPSVESSNEVFQLLQQIKVILGTKPHEVLGSPEFGIDLEKYLFQMNYDEKEIISLVTYTISKYIHYDTKKWRVKIDVKFGHAKDAAYEYALVDISVNEQKCLGIIVNQ